jgi:hypothetical protein
LQGCHLGTLLRLKLRVRLRRSYDALAHHGSLKPQQLRLILILRAAGMMTHLPYIPKSTGYHGNKNGFIGTVLHKTILSAPKNKTMSQLALVLECKCS